MCRILFALIIAASVASADAKPAKPEAAPEAAAITHAGDICKATGGFGRVFGRGYGHVDTTADDEWAPFERLTIEAGRITAEASFNGSGDSLENDVANAEKFLKALDHAVTAKGHFPHRDASGNTIRFANGKQAGSGVTLVLRQEQELIVALCSGG